MKILQYNIHTDFWFDCLVTCNCILFSLEIMNDNILSCLAVSYVDGCSRNMFDNAINNIFRFNLSCHSKSNVRIKILHTR